MTHRVYMAMTLGNKQHPRIVDVARLRPFYVKGKPYVTVPDGAWTHADGTVDAMLANQPFKGNFKAILQREEWITKDRIVTWTIRNATPVLSYLMKQGLEYRL